MLLLSVLALFTVLFSAIAVFGYRRIVKPSHILDQVKVSTVLAGNGAKQHIEDEQTSGWGRFFAYFGSLMPTSPQEAKHTRKELSAAGFRYTHSAVILGGVKIVGCAVFLLVALATRNSITPNPTYRLMITVFAAFAGYQGPSIVVTRLAKRRRERILRGLPDVLDLLVIATEAGCALDKALQNVSREFRDFHPEISEELALVNAEMLAGNSRTDALRNFGARTGEEELNKLVAILVQTDRFGTSIAEALRTQSEFLRTKRRQDAEEKAAKVGVKLIFPIFFFCMPALMVVVAGPGFLQMIGNLKSLAEMK